MGSNARAKVPWSCVEVPPEITSSKQRSEAVMTAKQWAYERRRRIRSRRVWLEEAGISFKG